MKKKIQIGETDALIIVDMHNDFVSPEGKLFVEGLPGESSMSQILMNIKKLAELPFYRRFTIEELHKPGHIEFPIHGEHCLEGTVGQLYHRSLIPTYDKANMHLVKGDNIYILSYSASASSEFLHHIVHLRLAEIKRVFIVGLAYNFCVGESAIDYARQGFEVFVVRNATRSIPPPPNAALSITEKFSGMENKLKLYQVKEIFRGDIAET